MIRPAGRDRGDLIALAIPLLAGGILCAIELGTRSFWLDEASTFAIASQHGAALWHGIAHDGGNMLIYYLFMHVVIAWFGHAAWIMRLPSVIATAVTGGLVAALALRLFADRRAAVTAGLLTVVSLPLVFWGQDARGYALLVTLSTASFLALVAILQTSPERAPPRTAVAAYVLTTLAAFYVSYDVALLIPGQLALLLIFRERGRLVIGCLVLVLVLCVPLVVLALQRGSGQLFWVTPLSWSLARGAALTVLSGGLPPSFHPTSTRIVCAALMAATVLSALALAGRALVAAWRGAERAAAQRPESQLAAALPFSWTVVPTVFTLVLYAAGEPIELPRVTILVIPALALLVAWLLAQRAFGGFRGPLVLAALLGLRLAQVIPSYGVSPEPWNAVTAHVLAATSADRPACVAFYPQDGREPFDYYLGQLGHATGNPAPQLTPVLPRLGWARVKPFVEVYGTLARGQRAQIARECPRLWLIASHEGQSRGTSQSRANLTRYRELERAFVRLYGHTRLTTFGWASPIHVRLLWR